MWEYFERILLYTTWTLIYLPTRTLFRFVSQKKTFVHLVSSQKEITVTKISLTVSVNSNLGHTYAELPVIL